MAAANIQPLIDQVKADEGVVDSATTYINGQAARIQAAIDQALANGATQAELQPLTDEVAAMTQKAGALSAAIAANP